MTDDNEKDRALRAALDADADHDVSPAAREAAVRDVAAIRRGLTLLADQANPPAPARSATGHTSRRTRRRLPRWAVAFPTATAAAALLVAGIIAWPKGGTGHSTAQPPSAPPIASTQPPHLPPQEPATLPNQVATAERIVVGTVNDVRVGKLADTRYVLALIRVTQGIKGPATDVVVLSVAAQPWRVGDRLLLFLRPDSGATAAALPHHLRLIDDKSGWYRLRGDRIVGAEFTLAHVRDLSGRRRR